MPPLGIYIHIPFCVKKCGYCDFASYDDKFQFIRQYIDALGREIEFYSRRGLLQAYRPITLYIGGGTPSLLTDGIVQIIADYGRTLQWQSLAEKSIEVNPGAVTDEQLRALREAGFNRISIGIQSFDQEELHTLGRSHSRDDAVTCFRQARAAGFQNISIDLMFGIPASTLSSWEHSLQQALALQPDHISMYNLTIEADTPFEALHQRKRLSLPDEDLQLAMYEHGIQRLTDAGYEHYEISNFARPGRSCEHNRIYWRNEEYLGLGAAAHSYIRNRRYWNTSEVIPYILKSMETIATATGNPGTVVGEEGLDARARMGETIMMNLRLRAGIDLDVFAARFGSRLESVYADVLDGLIKNGLVEIVDRHLRLSLRGLYLSNTVFQEFIAYDISGHSQ